MPRDAVPGSTIPEDSEAEALLQDGSWVWCQVAGQRKDRHGRWCGCISERLPLLVKVRAKAGPKASSIVTGGPAMLIHQYVAKAVQDDAPRAGEQNRLLLEARRARMARRKGVVSAAPLRRLTRLVFRRAPA